jgi:hypothetical protein
MRCHEIEIGETFVLDILYHGNQQYFNIFIIDLIILLDSYLVYSKDYAK